MRLLRIDPRTDRVVARIPMRTGTGARFVPVDVRIVGRAVWAVGLDGVLRVDPRTDSARPGHRARHSGRRSTRDRDHGGVRLGADRRAPACPLRHPRRPGRRSAARPRPGRRVPPRWSVGPADAAARPRRARPDRPLERSHRLARGRRRRHRRGARAGRGALGRRSSLRSRGASPTIDLLRLDPGAAGGAVRSSFPSPGSPAWRRREGAVDRVAGRHDRPTTSGEFHAVRPS